MDDTFYAIGKTDANTDQSEWLYDQENNAEGKQAEEESTLQLKPERFTIEVQSADGSSKGYEFTTETILNAKGGLLKKITRVVKAVSTAGLSEKNVRKVVSAVSTGGLSQTKAGKKVSAKVEKTAAKVDKAVDKAAEQAVKVFKIASLAVPRAAFTSLSAINIFGIASHLQSIRESGEKGNVDAAKKWKKVRDFWYKMGGSRNKFDKIIKNGSKKKPFLAKVKKKKSADGTEETIFLFAGNEAYEHFHNVAGVDDAAIAAWVGIATSVIAAVKSIAGKPKEMDDESSSAIDSDAAAESEDFNKMVDQESKNQTPEAVRDLNMPTWGWFAIAGGLLAITGIVIYAVRHSKKK
jgi:hypothetical protein